MEKVNPRTHCNHCRGKLTKDEKRGCMICRVCHPESGDKPLLPQKKPKLLDVKFTEEQIRDIIKDEMMGSKFDEEQIRDIVRDELENWHIQKPSVAKDEAKELTASLTDPPRDFDWRKQAKELGINSFGRKKAEVLEEIAKKKAS